MQSSKSFKYIYIYIYIYVCVCVCSCFFISCRHQIISFFSVEQKIIAFYMPISSGETMKKRSNKKEEEAVNKREREKERGGERQRSEKCQQKI